MDIFSRIENPIVAYFDDKVYFDYFKQLRKKDTIFWEKTLVLEKRKEDLWAFKMLPNISKIFSDPNYPKFLPNTVNPEYSCAMHAKYGLVSKTIEMNPFSTDYYAWIDIGLFRDLDHTKMDMFHIDLPPDFNVSTVAYNQVYPRKKFISPKEIYLSNLVWVCGCFFIGHKEQLTKWVQHYMNYTVYSLQNGLINTDQQVIYAMVNDQQYNLDINVQVYGPNEQWGKGNWNPWFHLAYLCIQPNLANN